MSGDRAGEESGQRAGEVARRPKRVEITVAPFAGPGAYDAKFTASLIYLIGGDVISAADSVDLTASHALSIDQFSDTEVSGSVAARVPVERMRVVPTPASPSETVVVSSSPADDVSVTADGARPVAPITRTVTLAVPTPQPWMRASGRFVCCSASSLGSMRSASATSVSPLPRRLRSPAVPRQWVAAGRLVTHDSEL